MAFIQILCTRISGEWFWIVNGQNPLTFQRVAALAYQQKMVSAKYLEKELKD